MHVSIVAALREHFGLERRPVRLFAPSSMLGLLDEDLLDVVGVDVAGLFPQTTSFGYPHDFSERPRGRKQSMIQKLREDHGGSYPGGRRR
jgi:hypothetical protein